MSDDLSAIFGTPATALGGILSKKGAPPARREEPEAVAVRTRPEEVPAQRTAEPEKGDQPQAHAVQQEPADSDPVEARPVRQEPEYRAGTSAPAQEDEGSAARTAAPPAKKADAPPAPSSPDRPHLAPAKPKRPAVASRTAPAAPAAREQRAVRPAAAPPAPAPRPQPVRAAEPVEELDVEVTSQLSVYVLPEAVQAIRKARQSSGHLNAEIAFDAIDSTRDILPYLVQARQVTPRAEGSLFPARRAARRGRRRVSEQQARTLWTIQITQAEHQVLKDLVAETGADSVSQLVSAAIEAYLIDDQPAR